VIKQEVTAADFLEYLLKNKSAGHDASDVAAIIDDLVWFFADNGQAIGSVLNEWIKSEDVRKVEVALQINGFYPADTRDGIVALLDPLKSKWPHLADRCAHILDHWDTQHRRISPLFSGAAP
jgi:hypothetical protein